MVLPPDTPLGVSFQSEGRVSGYDGCNRFWGSFDYLSDPSLGQIRIGRLASTRRGCRKYPVGRDQLMTVLRQDSLVYIVMGDKLELYSVDDQGDQARGAQFTRINRSDE